MLTQASAYNVSNHASQAGLTSHSSRMQHAASRSTHVCLELGARPRMFAWSAINPTLLRPGIVDMHARVNAHMTSATHETCTHPTHIAPPLPTHFRWPDHLAPPFPHYTLRRSPQRPLPTPQSPLQIPPPRKKTTRPPPPTPEFTSRMTTLHCSDSYCAACWRMESCWGRSRAAWSSTQLERGHPVKDAV